MKAANKFFLIFYILFVLSISRCFIDESIGQTSQHTEKELREIIRANPNYAKAHYNLGFLNKDINKKDEAKREFLIARRLFEKQNRTENVKKVDELLDNLK